MGTFVWYWLSLRLYFLYNPISPRKDRISSMLTLSKRSFILLIKRFLMRAKAPHSMRKCLTVQGVWHVAHWGCCSCLSIKECVSLVWPMCSLDIMTCSFLDFLETGLQSPKVGLIMESLLWVLLFQRCCHFVWKNLFIFDFKSVYGILNL